MPRMQVRVAANVLGHAAQEALWLAGAVSLPVLALAAAVGLVVAAFQAASQLQDPTAAHLPRLVVVVIALALLGPWMAREIKTYATRTITEAARVR